MSENKSNNPVEEAQKISSPRIARGGSWSPAMIDLRVFNRLMYDVQRIPGSRYYDTTGFRIARTKK